MSRSPLNSSAGFEESLRDQFMRQLRELLDTMGIKGIAQEGIVTVAGVVYDGIAMISGGLSWVGDKIWQGVLWLGEKIVQMGEWLYRSLTGFFESIKMAFESIGNVLSYVLEFGVIIFSLICFVGAIVLYNKLLMVVRDALYGLFTGMKKTYHMVGGGGGA